jgi:small-conductance mechanosensitive channel
MEGSVQAFSTGMTNSLHEFFLWGLGNVGARPVFADLTVADFAVIAFYLSLAAAVNVAVALILRARRRRAVGAAAQVEHHVTLAVGKPLYLIVWLYALHLAATPIFVKFEFSQGVLAARHFLDYLFNLAGMVAIFWLLIRATRVVEARLAAWAATTPSQIDDLVVPLVGAALRTAVVVVAVILELPTLGLPSEYATIVSKLTSIGMVLVVAGLLTRTVSVLVDAMLLRFDLNADDNLEARKASTRFHLIGRVLYVLIAIFAVAGILMMFQEVRHIGTSLLASAGIAGIVVGFAAQKTLANLFAGFQLAFSQPVRQDDVVVVEGEWGRIEEITLTYVVVRIWDDRRLVLPLSYFIEKPFQNWTRTAAAITGSVFVWVDYSFPVDEARQVLRGIIEASDHWDRRFWNLQVTDTSEKCMQLRVLATSADSSKNFNLRCEIREKLLTHIQHHFPSALPVLRVSELGAATAGS